MNYFSWHAEALNALAARAAQLPHALLFKGAAGIGKRAFAHAVAQGLLCEASRPSGQALNACGKCEACHWMASDAHPDFRLLQPESAAADDDAEPGDKRKKQDISVAQVRALADFINISSHRNGAKVVLVAPAEAMNVNAANALLKSLEEPPPATYFLLVSDAPHRLPATIRSRCQQIALPPPTREAAAAWLKEQGGAQPELALAQAGGAPVLAAELDTPEYWAARAQFLDGLAARSFDPLMLAERFAAHPVAQWVGWLQRWSYDLALLAAAQRLRYNPDRQDALAALARRIKALDVLRFCRDITRFQRVVHHPLNARLTLEDWLMRYGELARG